MTTLNKHFSRLALGDAKAEICKANERYEAALKIYIQSYYSGEPSLETRIQMEFENLEDASETRHWPDETPSEIEVLERILEEYC